LPDRTLQSKGLHSGLAVKGRHGWRTTSGSNYIAKRTVGVRAWFGRTLEETTLIELKV